MCRFVAYMGREIFLSDLLIESEQSLIRQSFGARERIEPLNGDGFGVGWYAHEIDPTPCVFASVTPAWSNRNLHRLAEKIRSNCIFAHVRAATPGSDVSENNCHPFQYGKFLWMHNGLMSGFAAIKRRLQASLHDDYFQALRGSTDSEHAFALFLHKLHKHRDSYDLKRLGKVMAATIRQLNRWSRSAGIDEPSHYNFALTDGYNLVATRYVSHGDEPPQTLYISRGKRFVCREREYDMVKGPGEAEAAIIASEPLTGDRSDWEAVPRNHMLTVSPVLHMRMSELT